MRIVQQKFTVRTILFSKLSAFIYLLIFCFFIYNCLLLLPIWLTSQEKAEIAKEKFEKKLSILEDKRESIENQKTPLGQERYKKDFFNKLDEGEHLIILYTETPQQREDANQSEMKMFWWEEMEQDFMVWWKNLDLWN